MEDQYYSTVAKNVEEARKLIKDGWEYIMDMDGIRIFRKPK
jgi:hypothetical protein